MKAKAPRAWMPEAGKTYRVDFGNGQHAVCNGEALRERWAYFGPRIVAAREVIGGLIRQTPCYSGEAA